MPLSLIWFININVRAVKEHLGISFLTDLKFTLPPFSAIRNHINSLDQNHNNNDLSINQFSMLTSANSELEMLIKESVLIKNGKTNIKQLRILKLENTEVCRLINDFLYGENIVFFFINSVIVCRHNDNCSVVS